MTQAMNLANFANNLDTSGGLNPSALNAATPVSKGGTGATTAAGARSSLSAAVLGANNDITSLTGLTTPLSIAQGGTGTASTTFANLTSNVTGTLPTANGGTNSTATPTAGGAGYGTGTAHAYTPAGTAGQVLVSAGSSAPTWAQNAINSKTAIASTSGTSIDFGSIPSGVKRITVMFNNVSLSGSSQILVQIGSGSVTSTGYNSAGSRTTTAVTTASSTAGYVINSITGSESFNGNMQILNVTSNTWVASHSGGYATGPSGFSGGGTVSLGGTLDRVRVTTVNGTDTFDAGSINILYE